MKASLSSFICLPFSLILFHLCLSCHLHSPLASFSFQSCHRSQYRRKSWVRITSPNRPLVATDGKAKPKSGRRKKEKMDTRSSLANQVGFTLLINRQWYRYKPISSSYINPANFSYDRRYYSHDTTFQYFSFVSRSLSKLDKNFSGLKNYFRKDKLSTRFSIFRYLLHSIFPSRIDRFPRFLLINYLR